MTDVTIRIYFRDSDGKLEDGKLDHGVEDFGGTIPVAGDVILEPGVLAGLDRALPENRRMWSVVRRVFNPRDNGGSFIALVVEERRVTEDELDLLP